MTKSLVQMHWDYFLLMERDLIDVSEFVELNKDNYKTYGPRILQLILSMGSELDVALKSFASVVGPEMHAGNMGDYRRLITEKAFEQFATAEVKILGTDICLSPWREVDNYEEAFPWWKAYNSVKHNRAENYSLANLEVALSLFAALFVVDAYLAEASVESVPGFTQIVDWRKHKRMPQLEEYYSANSCLS